MDDFIKLIGLGVVGFCIVIFVGLLQGLPVWLLWNAVIPSIFGLPSITFWQAIALSILCGCLFKSTSSSSK
jgi:hypothetical protein